MRNYLDNLIDHLISNADLFRLNYAFDDIPSYIFALENELFYIALAVIITEEKKISPDSFLDVKDMGLFVFMHENPKIKELCGHVMDNAKIEYNL